MTPYVCNLWRSLRRRFYAGVTLFSYLVAALGLPLPAAAFYKDANQPFPCQDHPCGCKTAEQCWRHCCCFSPEDRFAWARDHNVQPPSYAEKPASHGWHSPRQRDLTKKPCCSSQSPPTSEQPSCCQNHQPSCCQDHDENNSQEQESQKPAKSKKGKGWVLGVMALYCQGHSTLWASAGTVLPPGPPLTWNPWPVLLDRITFADEFASILSCFPPEPPPRLPLA